MTVMIHDLTNLDFMKEERQRTTLKGKEHNSASCFHNHWKNK